MSRLKEYLEEAKKMDNTMIGFGISKESFERLSTYIKSWLKRYDVSYDEIKAPHFTIAQITGKYNKDELVRELHKINKDIKFNPKDLKIFRGKNIPKDFIVLEYKPNQKFVNLFNDIQSRYEVRYFGSIKPHISLFTIEPNTMTDELFQQMKHSLPKIPSVRPVNKELFNKNFKVEYKER